MGKRIRNIALALALAATLLLQTGVAHSQVGPDALKSCREFAFSTEEDFVTHGPEPADGNPVISDGDLLGLVHGVSAAGPQCVVCARNYDLLHDTFDVDQDLGLDAADVIDVDEYLVAFSTELDSPHGDQFTAGDLLVTNGAIIANVALTNQFDVGYDIGLDAVHFVGEHQDILAFLNDARGYGRERWTANPGLLTQLLDEYDVDIWFSTEGTMWLAEGDGFLDGDVLSARNGIIVATNDLLMPPGVPADIRDGGVDFGADAVTTSRAGDRELLLFSTEILHRRDPALTDGDVLQLDAGVVRTNEELIRCFEPEADFLGLDALSVAMGGPLEACTPIITQVGGMAAASINADGYANGMSVDLTFEAHDSPFGGSVKILGLLPDCAQCEQFKVEYGEWIGPNASVAPTTWHPITPTFDEWVVITPWLHALEHREADPDDWYDVLCNPVAGGLLMPWNTTGLDGKYSLRLTIKDAGGIEHVSSPQVVVLDNTRPTASMSLDTVPVCGDITAGVSVTGQITATDEHFHGYQLRYESSAGNGTLLQRTYTGPTDQGDSSVPFTWTTTGLPKCGYRLVLRVWDRTIVNNHRSYGNPGFGWREVDDAYFCVRAQ
jgi:hypothetical protein